MEYALVWVGYCRRALPRSPTRDTLKRRAARPSGPAWCAFRPLHVGKSPPLSGSTNNLVAHEQRTAYTGVNFLTELQAFVCRPDVIDTTDSCKSCHPADAPRFGGAPA